MYKKLMLSDKERDMLPKNVKITRKVDNVEPTSIDSFHVKGFLIDYMKSRGISSPKLGECMLARFSDVEMHVDCISELSCATLVIMIAGSGTLIHTKRSKKYRGQFECQSVNLSEGDVTFFDFHLPHQFKTNQQCLAILADINRKQLEKMANE